MHTLRDSPGVKLSIPWNSRSRHQQLAGTVFSTIRRRQLTINDIWHPPVEPSYLTIHSLLEVTRSYSKGDGILKAEACNGAREQRFVINYCCIIFS